MLIAQHPREEFHSLNTARIVERSLENSHRIVASVFELDALLRPMLTPDTAVVYPSPDAEPLESLPSSAHPRQLLVLDGTWHHAKTLLRDVPCLSTLRKIRFSPESPSRYKLRKEPHRDYLSTLEAVHHLLQHLEPDTPELGRLLSVFEHMISLNQAAHRQQGRNARFLQRSKQRAHRFPLQLLEPEQRLVSVYAEGALGSDRHRQPLWFGLERPFSARQERLVGVLHTANLPANQLLLRLAITPDEWQAGLPVQRARQQITEFLRPHDVLCAWNSSSHQILCELGVGVQGHEQQGHAQLVLKGAYCDYVRYLHFAQSVEGTSMAAPCKFGELDQILKSLGLASSAAQPGRGSQRLAQTSAMLAWLRRHAFNHLK